MKFVITESRTPNGYTKIVVHHDDRRKVIIDRSLEKARIQRDYYVNMITGVTAYDNWLKDNRSR